MNLTEFARVEHPRERTLLVDAEDFRGPTRTLLYGYTVARETVHVYYDAEDGKIHKVVYSGTTDQVYDHQARDDWHCAWLLPSKRVYPECSDFQFADVLRDKGVDIPFTRFDPRHCLNLGHGRLHGKTYEQLMHD
jgi:hypothetical protein